MYIPTTTLRRTRKARYSTPPNSSGLSEVRSIDGCLDFSSLRRPLGVLPRTNMDETARSIEVALLILLVSDSLRRNRLLNSPTGLIWSSSSSAIRMLTTNHCHQCVYTYHRTLGLKAGLCSYQLCDRNSLLQSTYHSRLHAVLRRAMCLSH